MIGIPLDRAQAKDTIWILIDSGVGAEEKKLLRLLGGVNASMRLNAGSVAVVLEKIL